MLNRLLKNRKRQGAARSRLDQEDPQHPDDEPKALLSRPAANANASNPNDSEDADNDQPEKLKQNKWGPALVLFIAFLFFNYLNDQREWRQRKAFREEELYHIARFADNVTRPDIYPKWWRDLQQKRKEEAAKSNTTVKPRRTSPAYFERERHERNKKKTEATSEKGTLKSDPSASTAGPPPEEKGTATDSDPLLPELADSNAPLN